MKYDFFQANSSIPSLLTSSESTVKGRALKENKYISISFNHDISREENLTNNVELNMANILVEI